MILTYKIKHNSDFSEELRKAKQVADFAVATKTQTSKDVSHFGLKSMIANQILRKYGRNKTIKKVSNANLIIPSQGIKFENEKIHIPCLKLALVLDKEFCSINQIEIGKEYAFISVTVEENEQIKTKKAIGVDLNTTGHCAVIGIPETGKVKKLGKKAHHIHKKYKAIRRSLQKQGQYKKVKEIKDRESRIVRDLNHKISKEIVETAKEEKAGINLEDLTGIRNNKKQAKSFKYSLNSWSYYQLGMFISYKAKLAGIPVTYINPAYTSQACSVCGKLGERNKKSFKCPNCGHVENADVNASFNIGVLSDSVQSISQLYADRDVYKGNSDIPREATV